MFGGPVGGWKYLCNPQVHPFPVFPGTRSGVSSGDRWAFGFVSNSTSSMHPNVARVRGVGCNGVLAVEATGLLMTLPAWNVCLSQGGDLSDRMLQYD